jgi:hypothetical protein
MLNAPSAAGTRVNRDAESLLRYALPVDNKEVRELQEAIEDIRSNIKVRRFSSAISDIQRARCVTAPLESPLAFKRSRAQDDSISKGKSYAESS